ncbi:hypothetical protein B0H19DRAFT_1115958 [Mycena capillaripes]|nr:hypothetical protein B0H19DRAFT_1115958 [Mycena capillaripes]
MNGSKNRDIELRWRDTIIAILGHVFLFLIRIRHLVHASDADQFEALLSRWGPDGMGKLGGWLRVPWIRRFLIQPLDPR